ncbi:MAG TPA: DNA-3-methyladenine glycosylase [Paludibacter sp.]|nr:DNA-3-methyladenine glycosylase [Paludibacter sp.]
MNRLDLEFYRQDAVTLGAKLLGKTLVRAWGDGTETRYRISETEAYLGEDDQACHARKGCTPRTRIMYEEGGHAYVYLIYGMYWLLNVVSGTKGHPQAVLICGIDSISGSGRVGRELKIDKSFYGESLLVSSRIWIEDAPGIVEFDAAPRIGVDYAGDEWKNKPWRFSLRK